MEVTFVGQLYCWFKNAAVKSRRVQKETFTGYKWEEVMGMGKDRLDRDRYMVVRYGYVDPEELPESVKAAADKRYEDARPGSWAVEWPLPEDKIQGA